MGIMAHKLWSGNCEEENGLSSRDDEIPSFSPCLNIECFFFPWMYARCYTKIIREDSITSAAKIIPNTVKGQISD